MQRSVPLDRNITKLSFGPGDHEEEEDREKEDDLGGLFRMLKRKREAGREDYNINLLDSSRFPTESLDWGQEEVRHVSGCKLVYNFDDSSFLATCFHLKQK